MRPDKPENDEILISRLCRSEDALCYNGIEVGMTIAKQKVAEIIKDLPDEVDIDELIYRLYLRQKIEAAEKDIAEGRTVSHEEVIKETSKWFEK